MAQSDRQGTGRHPHKSSEEPYPHTKDNQGGEGEHRSQGSHSSHSGGSERSSQSSRSSSSHSGGSERSSHSSRDGESNRSSRGSQHGESSRAEHGGSEDSDLKEREYRDEQGNIHHHTRTYMEQHKGEQDKK
jgi:hypothetical protein